MGIPGGPNPLLMRRAAAAADDDSYKIEKSLRLEEDDSAELIKSNSAIGNTRTWTVSFWVKRSGTLINQWVFSSFKAGSGNYVNIGFYDNNLYTVVGGNPDATSGNYSQRVSTADYRDFGGWMHYVVAFDSNESTALRRHRMYINGQEVTDTSDNACPANLYTYWNSTYDMEIGSSGADNDQWCSLYLADAYSIDGLALTPAAFAKYSDSGSWEPIAFKLPTPNSDASSPTWSSMCSGTVYNSNHGYAKAFDGDPTTQCHSQNGGEIVFTPTGGLDFNTFALGYTYCTDYGQGDPLWCKINDINIIEDLVQSSCANGYYKEVDLRGKYGIDKINTIKWTRQSDGDLMLIDRIFIDGVVLVDGKTDIATRTNPNDGTTWSDGTVVGGTWSGYPWTNCFNGNLASGTSGASGTTSTLTLPKPQTGQIDVFLQNNTSDIQVNGSTQSVSGAIGHESGAKKLSLGSITLTSIGESGGNNEIRGITVNGHMLIDSSVDNSFHLKFNDTSSNAALGYSSFGPNFTESHTATGGPILKTNITGQTVTSGNNTDPDDSNLKLGIAGNAFSDTEGGTITASGSVISGAKSKFYGSSIFFDGSNDYVTCPSSLWAAGGDYTFEAWLYADSIATSGGNVIFHTGGSGQLCIQNNNSGYRILCHPEGGHYFRSTNTIPLDEWFHLAFTQTNDTRIVYINGVKNTSYDSTSGNPQTQDWNSPTGALTLGHLSNNNRAYWDGHMQDIRIYDKIKYTSSFTPPTRHGDFSTVTNLVAAATHPNNGTVWSTYLTSTNGWWPNFTNVNSFDGSPETGNYTEGGSNATITFAPPGGITYTSKVEVLSKSGTNAFFNGGSGVSMANNTWIEMATGSGTFQTLVCSRSDSTGGQLAGIKVDGTILQDSTGSSDKDVDSFVDTPTNYVPTGGTEANGGVTRGTYCTLNPLETADNSGSNTIKQGNLYAEGTSSAGAWHKIRSTMAIPKGDSGKWYYEVEQLAAATGGIDYNVGWDDPSFDTLFAGGMGDNAGSWCYKAQSGNKRNSGTNAGYGNAWNSVGDVLGVGYDNGSIYFWKNGTIQNSGTAAYTSVSALLCPTISIYTESNSVGKLSFNFGQRAFKYAQSGYHGYCTQNLPDTFSGTAKNNPSKYFDIRPYKGTAASKPFSLRFSPDLIWTKQRSSTGEHRIQDQIRGTNSQLRPNDDAGPLSETNNVTAFSSTGYTIGANGDINSSSHTHVAWIWDCGTAEVTPSSSYDITPDEQWVNTAAGFSITQYEGNGSSDQHIPHGLLVAPSFAVVKKMSSSGNDGSWMVKHVGLNSGNVLSLDNPEGQNAATMWYGVFKDHPDAVTVEMSTNSDSRHTNESGADYILYCWASIDGYSSFGKYEGGLDPTFVYTGMRPKLVMIKCTSHSDSWLMYDSARNTYNVVDDFLQANNYEVEATGNSNKIDILSNGFAVRGAQNGTAASGRDYIYCAWAEAPFKTSRAR